jgi:hypothetical protein
LKLYEKFRDWPDRLAEVIPREGVETHSTTALA